MVEARWLALADMRNVYAGTTTSASSAPTSAATTSMSSTGREDTMVVRTGGRPRSWLDDLSVSEAFLKD